MIITAFLVTDKANRVRFFKEIFLMVNISLKVVFVFPNLKWCKYQFFRVSTLIKDLYHPKSLSNY